jgi:hypothetical protein
VPTDNWQDVPDGAELPGDLWVRTDKKTGKTRARLKPSAKSWRTDPAERHNWAKPDD